MPVLDAAHETLLRAFRVAARAPYAVGRFNFGPLMLNALTARWQFPDALRAAIVRPTPAGFSSSAAPATLIAPAQVKAVRDALIAEGTIAVAETDRAGRPLAWDYTPTTPFPSHDAYRAALRALFTTPTAPPAPTAPPTRRAPPPVKLASPTPRALSAERVQNLNVGTVLRMGGTRAVKVASYGSAGWLIEPGDTRASDEAIAGMGEWAIEAYAPAWKRHAEIVYLDLDGTGRKVYRAEASRYEVDRYDKAWKAYDAAKARGETPPSTPSPIAIYRVQHAGREYTLTPSSWLGVTDALAWKELNESRPTRRAEAQAKADRRALSLGALRALSAMVLAVLSDGRERSPYPLTPTDLWRDLTENRRNVFGRMRDENAISTGFWREAFTPEGDDDALLNDAVSSQRTGTRLITGALRWLTANGWITERLRDRDNAVGFVRSARTLPSATVERLTDYTSDAYRAEREADATEARLRREHGGFSGYGYLNAPAWKHFDDTRSALRAARAAVAHPFATEADINRLNAAIAALRALAAPEGA